MAQIAALTKGQFATIDWVLETYRKACALPEGHIRAMAEAAPNLDGWLRFLLEIVKVQTERIGELEEEDKRFRATLDLLQETDKDRFKDHDEELAVLERQITKLKAALKVTWIPCDERMPDNSRFVWTAPWWNQKGVAFASWRNGSWWVGWQCLKRPGFTQWAEIRWPDPPEAKD